MCWKTLDKWAPRGWCSSTAFSKVEMLIYLSFGCWHAGAVYCESIQLGQMTDDGPTFEIALADWDSLFTQHGLIMELVKSRPLLVNLILHVRCVCNSSADRHIKIWCKVSWLNWQFWWSVHVFLYFFYRLRLGKVSQSVSNESYLVLPCFIKLLTRLRCFYVKAIMSWG